MHFESSIEISVTTAVPNSVFGNKFEHKV